MRALVPVFRTQGRCDLPHTGLNRAENSHRLTGQVPVVQLYYSTIKKINVFDQLFFSLKRP